MKDAVKHERDQDRHRYGVGHYGTAGTADDVRLVPLSIAFGNGKCPWSPRRISRAFFEQLYEERELPTTGQPSPEAYLNEYREAEKNQEDVLVLTLSGGLSGTIRSAQVAKELSGYDRVTILDTRQAILTQRMLVERVGAPPLPGKERGGDRRRAP